MNNQELEIEHDKKILASAEKTWGRTKKAGRLRLERRTKMIISTCEIGPGKKVLEIGCGTGTLTEALAKTGADITATDLFDGFLKLSQKKITSPNVKFQIADAEKLDNFSDNSFDVVCGLSILHHLDTEQTLANIYRVLKPGGYLAFAEPNMANPQIAIQKNIPFIKKLMGDSPGETAFFNFKIKKDLAKHGFKNPIATPFDFLHPAAPDLIAKPLDKVSYTLEKIPVIKQIAGSLFITAQKPPHLTR